MPIAPDPSGFVLMDVGVGGMTWRQRFCDVDAIVGLLSSSIPPHPAMRFTLCVPGNDATGEDIDDAAGDGALLRTGQITAESVNGR